MEIRNRTINLFAGQGKLIKLDILAETVFWPIPKWPISRSSLRKCFTSMESSSAKPRFL
jgi:hypothetical protein